MYAWDYWPKTDLCQFLLFFFFLYGNDHFLPIALDHYQMVCLFSAALIFQSWSEKKTEWKFIWNASRVFRQFGPSATNQMAHLDNYGYSHW